MIHQHITSDFLFVDSLCKAPKNFLPIAANRLYVIYYVPHTLPTCYTEKWGPNYYLALHCVEWGPVATCNGALERSYS